jgi:hypothetical protein
VLNGYRELTGVSLQFSPQGTLPEGLLPGRQQLLVSCIGAVTAA